MWHRAVQLAAPLGLPSLQPGRDCHPHRPGFRRGDRYRDTCGDCCASAFSSQIFPVCGLIYLGCACMGCSWASSHCLEKSQLRYSGQTDAVRWRCWSHPWLTDHSAPSTPARSGAWARSRVQTLQGGCPRGS